MDANFSPNLLIQRFSELLSQYLAIEMKPESQLSEEISSFISMVENLLSDYRTLHDEWAITQKKTAEEFNLLEILKVDTKELCHSRLLEWLLAKNIEKGTHAQGNLGFQLFLEETELDLNYANLDYWVQREVASKNSRIDVEIASSGNFIIHIENKINAPEYEKETSREWKDLKKRACDLKVPEVSCHAIFLTLDGKAAEESNFLSLTWSRVARIMEKFANLSEAHDVSLFARHYATALRKLSASTLTTKGAG